MPPVERERRAKVRASGSQLRGSAGTGVLAGVRALPARDREPHGAVALKGTEEMAAHGRRVGREQGKRLAKAHHGGLVALRVAIEVEDQAVCRDAWCSGYVEGLHDALREAEGRQNLRRLDR